VATILVAFSVGLLTVVYLLRRSADSLRGVTGQWQGVTGVPKVNKV